MESELGILRTMTNYSPVDGTERCYRWELEEKAEREGFNPWQMSNTELEELAEKEGWYYAH